MKDILDELTPTERRIMRILGDGLRHNEDELLKVVDTQADNQLLNKHVSNIRAKIAHKRLDIVSRSNSKGRYFLLVQSVSIVE